MNCPECGKLLDFLREENANPDLDDMSLSTNCEYFCPKCQRTFITIHYYVLNPEEEYFVRGEENE